MAQRAQRGLPNVVLPPVPKWRSPCGDAPGTPPTSFRAADAWHGCGDLPPSDERRGAGSGRGRGAGLARRTPPVRGGPRRGMRGGLPWAATIRAAARSSSRGRGRSAAPEPAEGTYRTPSAGRERSLLTTPSKSRAWELSRTALADCGSGLRLDEGVRDPDAERNAPENQRDHLRGDPPVGVDDLPAAQGLLELEPEYGHGSSSLCLVGPGSFRELARRSGILRHARPAGVEPRRAEARRGSYRGGVT